MAWRPESASVYSARLCECAQRLIQQQGAPICVYRRARFVRPFASIAVGARRNLLAILQQMSPFGN